MADVGVIVVAAGSGSRLGHTEPKAFVEFAGKTLVEHALDRVCGMSEAAEIVLVVPVDREAEAERLAAASPLPVVIVVGGSHRQASVAAGLAALGSEVDVVLVHDCARPLTPSSLFDTVVEWVRATGDGVIPGLAVADTLKRTDAGLAVETVDRSLLTAVQTPQGFPRRKLVDAYAAAATEYTDDAALYSAAGHSVRVIDGDPLAFKITTPADLERARHLAGRGSVGLRTGVGIDVHAFDASAPLWLGGILWPDEPGLAGHSDGDALSHAICDALLSAAGLGDIGGRFGTDDPRFAGAHGEVFIRETVVLVEAAGFVIQNVAVQLVAKAPRFAPRREEVERRLGALVGAPVSVSATTSDGLGFTGRGEGVAAYATALLALAG